MSGLTLHVRNFRAIKSADIELAGLTVLAGVNSSGKSTLVRLFHRLICIEANYNSFAAIDTHRFFRESVVQPLKKVFDQRFRDRKLQSEFEWLSTLKWQMPRDGERLISNLAATLRRSLADEAVSTMILDPRFADSLHAYLPKDCTDVPKFSASQNISQWVDEIERFFLNYYKSLVERRQGSSSLYFSSNVVGEDFGDVWKSEPHLTELKISDGDIGIVDLTDKQLPMGNVFTPRQSFYIAQPAADFPSVRTNKLRLNGMEYPIAASVKTDNSPRLPEIGVDSLIGGIISAPREKGYVATADWLYNDGENSYNLVQCADGIKSLATISILDKYQLLGAGALLIIDEPEVHLHPQWVVGMARVLVKLAKERNVKVLITTHSPDLVHAIRDFSENENFAANTCFYLSHKAEQSDAAYTFRPLGMGIGPIFAVFNRAKEQIAEIAQSIREG